MQRTFTRRLATSLLLLGLFPAARASAADVWFNTEPDVDLTSKVLEAMDRNVAAAGDKPVEFDANVFAFTSDAIADKMLALAKDHANLSVNIVTDWSSLAASGSRKGPYLERAVAGDYAGACAVNGGSAAEKAACVQKLDDLLGGQPLTNIQVHYKKDDPYRWDASAHAAVYDHAKTQGLDHHKGLAIVVDGVPTELLTGSFNWSPTANDDNFENLMHFDRTVPAEREIIKSYAAETRAMFHNAAVSLSGKDAIAWKTWLLKKYAFDNQAGPNPGDEPVATLAADDAIIATCPVPSANPTLEELVNSVNGAVAVTGGTFTDDPAGVDPNGIVVINRASQAELETLQGVGPVTAKKILSWIGKHGPMQSKADLRAAGLSQSLTDKVAAKSDFRFSEAFYSSHLFGCPDAGTGFAAMNAVKTTTVRNATDDGVTRVHGSLPAPAIDLFRRATPEQTIRIAAYSYGANSPEFMEMAKAADRGVKVQVVLYDQYNGAAVSALQSLAAAHPGQVEVKLIKNHVMHEKFAVVGDDVFDGSSNLNASSTGKHAEDRFFIQNDAALAGEFTAEFDRLWAIAKAPAAPNS